ncbi:MAG: TetR family transcriptional regulator [Arachnia sp.]
MRLTRQRIVSAAVEILDVYGLADLTMRRVAEAVEVRPGALYWHIPNKQTLLALCSDAILEGIDADPGQGWDAGRRWAARLHDRLVAHRDGAELVVASQAAGLGSTDLVAQLSARLAGAVAPEQAEALSATVVHFVLGQTMTQQVRQRLAELAVVESSHTDLFERQLTDGLDFLLTPTSGAA